MKTNEQFLHYVDAASDDATRWSRMREYADALREWGDDYKAHGWEYIASRRKTPQPCESSMLKSLPRCYWFFPLHACYSPCAYRLPSDLKPKLRRNKNGPQCRVVRNYPTRLEAEKAVAQATADFLYALAQPKDRPELLLEAAEALPGGDCLPERLINHWQSLKDRRAEAAQWLVSNRLSPTAIYEAITNCWGWRHSRSPRGKDGYLPASVYDALQGGVALKRGAVRAFPGPLRAFLAAVDAIIQTKHCNPKPSERDKRCLAA